MPNCCCDLMYGDKCQICQDAADCDLRIKEARSWSWNLGPQECADRANELGWNATTTANVMKRAGFKEREIKSVVFMFNSVINR